MVFTFFALFFLLPLLAMLRFSFEGSKLGTWSGSAWSQIVSYAGPPPLLSAVEITLELGVLTSVVTLALLVPTMIWIRLRVQWISQAFEFPVRAAAHDPGDLPGGQGWPRSYNRIGRHVELSALMLFWAYVILALPYAYRALAAGLNAIDVKTLSEAARSLGASWFTVMFRVIAPNMWQAILNALLLSAALALGEFTIAYTLLYTNLQVELFSISRNTPNASVIFSTSLAALIFAFILLLIVSYAGRRRRRGMR